MYVCTTMIVLTNSKQSLHLWILYHGTHRFDLVRVLWGRIFWTLNEKKHNWYEANWKKRPVLCCVVLCCVGSIMMRNRNWPLAVMKGRFFGFITEVVQIKEPFFAIYIYPEVWIHRWSRYCLYIYIYSWFSIFWKKNSKCWFFLRLL